MSKQSRRIAVCTVIVFATVTIGFFNFRTARLVLYKLPIGGTFDKYSRLTKFLHLGMSPAEVQALLGAPESVQSLTNGLRWRYDEVAPTTGWEYVAEFEGAEGSFSLVYLRNAEHVVFPTSRRWELGRQLQPSQVSLRR